MNYGLLLEPIWWYEHFVMIDEESHNFGPFCKMINVEQLLSIHHDACLWYECECIGMIENELACSWLRLVCNVEWEHALAKVI